MKSVLVGATMLSIVLMSVFGGTPVSAELAYPPTEPTEDLAISNPNPEPGQPVTLTMTGCTPGETVELSLGAATPTWNGPTREIQQVVCSVDGTAAATFLAPASGNLTARARGLSSGLTFEETLLVSVAPVANPAALPVTGSNESGQILWIAGPTLAAGLGLGFVAIRRRRYHWGKVG